MTLDERMRSRLRALAEQDQVQPLDPEARERVVARVQSEGPALVKRHAWTWGARALALGTAIAAAAALALYWRGGAERPVSETALGTPASPGSELACPTLPPLEGGVQALGQGATLGISPGASVRWIVRDECAPELTLERGEIVVDAAARESPLRVRHEGGVIVARGARFVVAASEERVELRVTFGSVSLESPSASETLEAGGSRRWELSGRPGAVAPAGDPRLLEAERAWRQGSRERATALFREVGMGSSPDAEAAWLRLARLRIEAGLHVDALEALDAHERRFRSGALGPEALFLRVEAALAGDDRDMARAAARQLAERFPGSAQARAARARVADLAP